MTPAIKLMPKMTPRREAILAYMESYSLLHGCNPTNREIRDEMGLHSSSTVHGHMVALQKLDKVYRTRSRDRVWATTTTPTGRQTAALTRLLLYCRGPVLEALDSNGEGSVAERLEELLGDVLL